ncbi:MAG TPA: TonB-dependent receptor [Pyrinomonadaceae bacterium]|nr:TonB-dependent receptor [Pyrinomonadaceae bacterium]
MHRSRVALFLLSILLISILVVDIRAQAVYGSIIGTVADEKGAAVVGATVTVTDLAKNVSRTVTTNDSGNYEARSLIPGKYQIKVEQTGYKAAVQEIEVRADVAVTADVALEVGAVSETVTISAEALELALKTDRADVSTSFTGKQLQELPIFNRNFTEIILASPGTQKLAWQHAASENPQGSTQTMVNGQHFSGTSYQLDGTDNRDPILGIIVINPTLEGVSEAKVTTQNFDAEFGMATAGVVTAQTRSGSNDPHGSAFMFRRNDIFQARDPFSQSLRNPLISGNLDDGQARIIPESLWSQFGGSFGWKILRDKSFVFGDYQGTRSKEGASVRTTVPILAARQPNAQGFFDLSAYPKQIYDPLTGDPNTGELRTAFAGNLIPANRISPQALALIRLFPAPNGPGINDNFSAAGTDNFDADQFNIRGDHYWSKDLHLFVRYSFAKYQRTKPGALGFLLGGEGLSGARFAGTSKVRNQSWAAGFDYVVNPRVITDFRFGYFKYKVNVLPGGFGTTPAADAGIPGLNLDDTTSGMPWFDIQGVGATRLGFALSPNGCNCPLIEEEHQFQFANNWTLLEGDHTYRFGADLRFAQNLRVPSDAHRAGQVHFNEARTAKIVANKIVDGGLGLATFLLGDVTNFERYVSTSTDAKEYQRRWFFYGQDTWKTTPKLTLNYGLRWELIFPEKIKNPADGSLLNLETGDLFVGGVGDVDKQFNVKPTYTAFAPRVGLAYQWTDKTVIRAGYGRSFDIGVFGSIFGHAVTQNLPVLAFQNLDDDDFKRVFTLGSGPPAPVFPPVPSDGHLPLPLGIEGRARPFKMRLPTLDAWNITVQHQLGRNTSLEAGYVGNKGTHVFAGDGPAYNANAPVAGPGPQANRRPFFSRFGWTQNITYYGNDADNKYNSLQTKFETRFSGLIVLAHYTLSAARNYSDNYFIHDRTVGYGPTSFDRKHALSFSEVWELPFGHGKKHFGNVSRAADLLVGGWQISSNTVIYSGLAFTPSVSGTNCSVNEGPCRPDLVGEAFPSDQSRNQWFIPAQVDPMTGAITGGPWAKAAAGQFGNVGSNRFRGPGFWQSNLALFKKFRVTESSNLEFRAEGFNIFNHVNLGQPRDCIDCNLAEAGKIFNLASGAQMRNFQFGLRYIF